MKSTKLALVTILLCGTLSACKPEAPEPVEDVTPMPAPSAPAVTPEPMVPDPTMPAPTDNMPTDSMEEEDTPHSGGDKVGTGGGNVG